MGQCFIGKIPPKKESLGGRDPAEINGDYDALSGFLLEAITMMMPTRGLKNIEQKK
jgi:hypothetical protein